MRAHVLTPSDADLAERAWRDGDVHTAIEAADRALTASRDPDGHAAAVAAAAAACDSTIGDAAGRWRRIADGLAGAAGAEARGRAALAAALLGDGAAAAADRAAARAVLPDPAPRRSTVLLDAVDALLAAAGGDLGGAATRLCGLAAITVPPDPFVVEPWDELAATAVAANGDDVRARAVLARCATPRGALLTAWLDLRTGRLAEVRAGLTAATGRSVLRRDAVLAAAVSVGLARRADPANLADTWRVVAPAVAGADVELLQLDVWGELSVAAAAVSEPTAHIAEAMEAAITRAGRPPWAVAAGRWWRVQRAAAGTGTTRVEPAPVPGGSAYLDAIGAATAAWSVVLAGEVDAEAVLRAGSGLVEVGRPWEASALCADALQRATDPVAAKRLLAAGRAMRGRGPSRRVTHGGLSARECEIGTLVLDGHTQREIGARLFISPKTVEQHVAKLRMKLEASTRAELVAGLHARLRGNPSGGAVRPGPARTPRSRVPSGVPS
ncbi:helix-turn-helix transcriptional regulator [Pseudonocardia saturnea]